MLDLLNPIEPYVSYAEFSLSCNSSFFEKSDLSRVLLVLGDALPNDYH